MKKLFVLFISISLMSLAFAAHNPVQELSEKPSDENFLKMYQDELNKEETSQLTLSYMLLISLNSKLENLADKSADLSPKEKFQIANLFLEIGKYEKAIALYDKINEDFPKWSCPWRHKGEALAKIERYKEAEKALKMAIEKRKEHFDAYVYLAEVQKKMNKYEEALKSLETGLSYKGKDIEDPEKELIDKDVQLLHLELLKLNEHDEEFGKLLKKLNKQYPDCSELKNY